jgi:hypothetical protein
VVSIGKDNASFTKNIKRLNVFHNTPPRQRKIAGKPPQLFHIIAGTFPQFSYICAE